MLHAQPIGRVRIADGSDAHEVDAAGGGVANPNWSRDGSRILLVRDDALWSVALSDDTATRVLGPIAPVTGQAPPDNVFEPTSANNYPTWESLLSWVP